MEKQLVEKKQAHINAKKKSNTRIVFIIFFALMIALLVFAFVQMAINNTGIVAKFGVWPALALCIATGVTGVFLGYTITKMLKTK